MKKITMVLVVCMLMGVIVSCGRPEDVEIVKNDSVAKSASTEFVLTKEKIAETLEKVYNDAISDSKALSGVKDAAETKKLVGNVPAYLSMDKVQTLSKSNYRPYYNEFYELQVESFDAVNALVEELPEKCVLSHCPEWIVNISPKILEYVILDPSYVTEENKNDLTLYLERECFGLAYNKNYDSYYDVDMNELEERFSDIGTVLVKVAHNRWVYFDVANKTFDLVEYFPGFSDVYKMYSEISSAHIQAHIDEVLTDEEKVK